MLIANKYKIIEKLGSGEFGTIFKGENIRTKEQIAIKLEPKSFETNMLKRETQIYKYLGKAEGIPTVKWFGTHEEYNYMVLPLYGDSLSCKTFSLLDVFSIGQKIIKILKYIHEKGLIHRDIKPDNFVLSQDGKDIYIIDFGLCRKYKDDTGKHIGLKTGKTIIGTLNYISVNVQNGTEPSRRDDLISLGYILLYLLNGGLPWLTKRENEILIDKKNLLKSTKIQIPEGIKKFMNYCETLYFEEEPIYDYLMSLLITE
jgi:serine/threonine protein kinase